MKQLYVSLGNYGLILVAGCREIGTIGLSRIAGIAKVTLTEFVEAHAARHTQPLIEALRLDIYERFVHLKLITFTILDVIWFQFGYLSSVACAFGNFHTNTTHRHRVPSPHWFFRKPEF